MVDMNIENIVASTHIARTLNLKELSGTIADSTYHPEDFPGLILHVKKPNTAVMLFSNGNAVCTGAKTMDDLEAAIKIALDNLKKAGVKVLKKRKIKVENMIVSSDMKKALDLKELAQALWLENVNYEPDQFPGLIYRMEKPKTEVLLFGSGKVVCTGSSEKDVSTAINKLTDKLASVGM